MVPRRSARSDTTSKYSDMCYCPFTFAQAEDHDVSERASAGFPSTVPFVEIATLHNGQQMHRAVRHCTAPP
eukprot:m.318374 g.318374  ORF g.318374 m.318374 type:complete len:71 (+) comp20289_c0_seq3:2026-2238(+)